MAKPEEAELCIKELNGTELKGRKITVEVVSWESAGVGIGGPITEVQGLSSLSSA